MYALITGGAGFIGSHLAERLIRLGHRVTVLDDLSTGALRNVEHLQGKPRFQFTLGSVLNRPVLAELVDSCDMVFHLAAAVGVKLIVQSPVHTIETNVKGTEVVLEFAAKKKKKVLVTSTSEVYGKTNKVPFAEDDDLMLGPTTKDRWSYACSKALDEFLALAYWRQHQLPVVIARLFNTVGPRQTGRYGMVLPTFVRQALLRHPITVYGDGSQSRCFTHVDDTVGALVQLALHPGAVGQVFNIGTTESVTIEELSHLVKRMTNSPSEIRHIPYAEAYEEGFEDMQQRMPDLRKIHSLFGYRPSKNLRATVQEVIDYFQHTAYV